jgi:hypothetical protein
MDDSYRVHNSPSNNFAGVGCWQYFVTTGCKLARIVIWCAIGTLS